MSESRDFETQRLQRQLQVAEETRDIREFPRALAIAAAERIPVFGAAVSAAIAMRSERRIERLEEAIEELVERVSRLHAPTVLGTDQDQERLAALFEEWTARTQDATSSGRRTRLVNIMVAALADPVTRLNFDEKRLFLSISDQLSDADAQFLAHLYAHRNEALNVSRLPGDPDENLSEVARLTATGLIRTVPSGALRSDPLHALPHLSELGERFCRQCLAGDAGQNVDD